MTVQYTLQEATFTLPDSDYHDTTVNIFKHADDDGHSIVVTRNERDQSLSLEEELKHQLKKVDSVGKLLQIVAVQHRMLSDKHGNDVPALLSEYNFDVQGKIYYQQQLITEAAGNAGKKTLLVFSYTQSKPFSYDDVNRALAVWDSVKLSS